MRNATHVSQNVQRLEKDVFWRVSRRNLAEIHWHLERSCCHYFTAPRSKQHNSS